MRFYCHDVWLGACCRPAAGPVAECFRHRPSPGRGLEGSHGRAVGGLGRGSPRARFRARRRRRSQLSSRGCAPRRGPRPRASGSVLGRARAGARADGRDDARCAGGRRVSGGQRGATRSRAGRRRPERRNHGLAGRVRGRAGPDDVAQRRPAQERPRPPHQRPGQDPQPVRACGHRRRLPPHRGSQLRQGPPWHRNLRHLGGSAHAGRAGDHDHAHRSRPGRGERQLRADRGGRDAGVRGVLCHGSGRVRAAPDGLDPHAPVAGVLSIRVRRADAPRLSGHVPRGGGHRRGAKRLAARLRRVSPHRAGRRGHRQGQAH
mmetsp:Transcript_11950/g.46614  ORF Transcript_11950/g.46614 Transcript_11950/m.46614 type:complete len:318 (-) Transcript_11950:377-1330(-)